LIISGGVLFWPTLIDEGKFFSVNGIDQIPEENSLLKQSFFKAYYEDPNVIKLYDQFNKTVELSFSVIRDNTYSSAEIIHANYINVIDNAENQLSDVELSWAEYELRRKVHFAAEILFIRDGFMEFDIDTLGSPFRSKNAKAKEFPVWKIALKEAITNKKNINAQVMFKSRFYFNKTKGIDSPKFINTAEKA
ncbi:unnamed protein product, partial [marine sediment metagenome]